MTDTDCSFRYITFDKLSSLLQVKNKAETFSEIRVLYSMLRSTLSFKTVIDKVTNKLDKK